VRRLVSLGLVACALALPAASLAAPSAILPGFRSPSGNIKCLSVPGPPPFLYCTVGQASYAKKLTAYCAQPRIGVDWAGFTLGRRGKGSVECSGGTLYDPSTQHPHYVTLAYGKTWRLSVFTCTSRTTGVTCRNRAGHGLFVSRESYRTW
jgi:Family of unknown function (DUF6636)